LSEPVVFNNPVYWRNIVIRGSVYGLAFLLAIALILTEGKGMTIVELGIVALMALILFYLFVGREEIAQRPKEVEIVDTGVVLHRRLLPGRKMVPWEEILSVNIYLGDPSKVGQEYLRDAYLWLKNERHYLITRPTALAMREAYRSRFGSYPLRGGPRCLGP
jgi:hypothetical protein